MEGQHSCEAHDEANGRHAELDGEIVTLDATAAIAARELSCREVMAAHLAGIEAVNATTNAIVSPRPADTTLVWGDTLGPPHGLPHAR